MTGYRTIKEVASHFGVHENTVRNWIDHGKLKKWQPFFGATVRIRVEDLAAFEKKANGNKKEK